MSMYELLNKRGAVVALVGATDNPMKYGNRIFRNLSGKGISVLPVNLGRSTIEGVEAFAELADLPERPDIVNVVVPPDQGAEIVQQVSDLGWDNIWFQPGAESGAASALARELGISVLDDGSCTMVSARNV